MKKIVLTMLAMLTMTAVMAQSNDKERKAPKQMTPEEMTTRMTKELSLTADQKSKVLSLNKEYQNYLGGPGMGGPKGPRPDGNAKNSSSDKQQRQAPPQMSESEQKQMKQNMAKRQEYDQKLKSILSSDQYTKYQKQQKRRGPGGNGKRPEKQNNN